jgi:hypothetical protein
MASVTALPLLVVVQVYCVTLRNGEYVDVIEFKIRTRHIDMSKQQTIPAAEAIRNYGGCDESNCVSQEQLRLTGKK